MRDIDERLTQGLRDLVDRAPVEAEVWDDTARYVRKHRQRRQAAIAGGVAAIVAAIGITAAVRTDGGKDASRNIDVAQQTDKIPQGTHLLAVRDRTVHALAADGRDLGGVVDLGEGAPVQSVQLSPDHKTLWYVNDLCPASPNGDLVELDLSSGRKQRIDNALAVEISPDGKRAVIARQAKCQGGSPEQHIYLRDLVTGDETELMPDPDRRAGIWRTGQIAWSPDGNDVAVEFDDEDASSAIWKFHVGSGSQPSKGVRVNAGPEQAAQGVAWTQAGLVTARWDASSGLDSNTYYIEQDGKRLLTTTTPIGDLIVSGTNLYVEGFPSIDQVKLYSVKSDQIVAMPGDFTSYVSAVVPGTLTPAPQPSETTSTTSTTTAPDAQAHDACPTNCIGKGRADVDGDGTLDDIGYIELQAPTGDAFETRVLVRVIFSDGRVAEHEDTGHFDPQWLGAADVFGDGMAKIFYFNEIGAHTLSGHILRFDGTGISAVNEAGKPFVITIDNYYLGDTSFSCDGGTLSVTTDQFEGTLDPNAPDGAQPAGAWSGTKTKYSWFEGQLDKVGEEPISFTTTDSDQSARVSGAHCPGLPEGPSNLLRPHTSDPALDGF